MSQRYAGMSSAQSARLALGGYRAIIGGSQADAPDPVAGRGLLTAAALWLRAPQVSS